MEITFAQVGTAKLLLTDALIAATRPLSLDGADEIEDELVPEGTEDEGLN
jgi:ribosome maturation factor RimP